MLHVRRRRLVAAAVVVVVVGVVVVVVAEAILNHKAEVVHELVPHLAVATLHVHESLGKCVRIHVSLRARTALVTRKLHARRASPSFVHLSFADAPDGSCPYPRRERRPSASTSFSAVVVSSPSEHLR